MGEGTVNEDDKKNENDVTPEGAVEVNEEDLDQASGGAIYMKTPADTSLKIDYTSPTTTALGDGSVKPAEYDLKSGYDLKKI
jgi:hypothetical protein